MKKITIIFIALLIILNLPATLLAAQKTITTYTRDTNIQVSGPSSMGQQGGSSFPPVVNDPGTPAIPAPVTVDPVTGAILLGNSVGNGSGALWYGGTSPSGTCNPCTSGVCTFGLGFRAYFEFIITTTDTSSGSTDHGDGFNFTIVNAANNDVYKRGGAPNANVSLGELLGYAGPGNTAATSLLPDQHSTLDGLGLEPPKMALEFDTYPNTGAMTYNGCSGGRNDTANNHIALMFWGTNPVATTMCNANSTAGNTFPQASFDDNIHGAGSGTAAEPYNSASTGNGSGLGGYYERAKGTSTYNWLEDNQTHRVRIEVIRIPSTYSYEMKAWVDCELNATPYTACPSSEYVSFQDVFNPYTNSTYPPKIDRTQILNAALNTSFNTILFGFTESTGGATQGIAINNFAIYFPPSTVGTPSNLSFTPSGGSGTVSLTAVTGCTWTTSNNGYTWITVTPASGTGTQSAQTVNYTVAANTGAARTGTMTIAGQTFTVTQTGCTYTVGTPSNLSFTASAGNGTVSVTASTGCNWTTSNNGYAWITVTPASSTGTGAAQTVNYSVTANTGVARTGTMTIAGQTFTVTQANGCTYAINPTAATPASGAGTGSVNVTAGTGCTWTASVTTGGSWLSITSGSSGTGNGTVGYSFTANTGIARTGTMTIGGQTFTVTQANGCTYSFGSCPAAFPRAGGTGSISVTTDTGCTWTSTDNQTWITTSPTSSSGTGSVTVTVAAGTALNTPRSGTVTVTGTMGTTSSTTCTITENH